MKQITLALLLIVISLVMLAGIYFWIFGRMSATAELQLAADACGISETQTETRGAARGCPEGSGSSY